MRHSPVPPSQEVATMSALLDAAESYAAKGWRVHPLRSRSKLPALKSWQKVATTNARTIRNWWRESGGANVGIATGPESGLLVLDVDGDARKLLRGRDVPNTAVQRTGGGGLQFFFRWTRELDGCSTTRAALLANIDTRGAGGYVVVPPSLHPTGKRYAWLDGCGPGVRLASPPDWLIELLHSRPAVTRTPDEEWRRIAGDGAAKGSRNNTLARLAGHLFSRRDLDAVIARELLLAWSQARCTPPMNEKQALRTIESIALKELQKCR
jgi:hypothetical protein